MDYYRYYWQVKIHFRCCPLSLTDKIWAQTLLHLLLAGLLTSCWTSPRHPLRNESSVVSEHAQCIHSTGGGGLRGHDSQLRPPVSSTITESSRRRQRRRIGVCPLPAGEEEEEELGVEPVLRLGGAHWRRAAVRREGTELTTSRGLCWENHQLIILIRAEILFWPGSDFRLVHFQTSSGPGCSDDGWSANSELSFLSYVSLSSSSDLRVFHLKSLLFIWFGSFDLLRPQTWSSLWLDNSYEHTHSAPCGIVGDD